MSKIKSVIEKAQLAFWMIVAEQYPELKTGDFPHCEAQAFDEACERAIKAWYNTNVEFTGFKVCGEHFDRFEDVLDYFTKKYDLQYIAVQRDLNHVEQMEVIEELEYWITTQE